MGNGEYDHTGLCLPGVHGRDGQASRDLGESELKSLLNKSLIPDNMEPMIIASTGVFSLRYVGREKQVRVRVMVLLLVMTGITQFPLL